MYAEQDYAYCSGQCQASRFPPVSCRCICGGRNHGILRYQKIIEGRTVDSRHMTHDQRFAEWMEKTAPRPESKQIAPLKQLPYLTRPKTEAEKARDVARMPEVRFAKATKRFLKKITGIRSQDDLNNSIIHGLRSQFNQDNTDKAIDQAFTIRQSRQPNANRPELYELYETGEIDEALEMMGKRWVIGRPKIRR